MLEPFTSRFLDRFELDQLEIEEFNQRILSSERFSFKRRIFHSRSFKKVGQNKCSYIISFVNADEKAFGSIKNFIQIDFIQNYFYAQVNVFKTISNCILNDSKIRLPDSLHRLKNSKVFDNYFYSCRRTEDHFLINVSSILEKCIVYEKSENIFYICEFFNEIYSQINII